jgi:hypothetical protein
LLHVLLEAFVGSFVIAFGWYSPLTPGIFWVGVGNLLYLFATLLAVGTRLSAFSARLGSGRP